MDQFKFELRHAEVQDDAYGVVRGVKIGVHLCHVHLDDSAIRLQLNDDSTVDDQVQKVLSNYARGVPDLDRLLPLHLKTIVLQFGDEGAAVDAFNESGSQSEMDCACRFNDSKDQALAGFHARPIATEQPYRAF